MFREIFLIVQCSERNLFESHELMLPFCVFFSSCQSCSRKSAVLSLRAPVESGLHLMRTSFFVGLLCLFLDLVSDASSLHMHFSPSFSVCGLVLSVMSLEVALLTVLDTLRTLRYADGLPAYSASVMASRLFLRRLLLSKAARFLMSSLSRITLLWLGF